ncbi:MAG TPA: glycoside hydrolase 43 family protein [Pyrinomonadaceae bacterium]|nr:glycoside hydrolase 43 family protein [Pyrinomonadaceae bacterium]
MTIRVIALILFCVIIARADGTYTNPIIDADYSDPDVIRVGDDFYLTASSFNCVPGLPILHSKDLVNWKIIGHALPRQPPHEHFAKPQHGNGVWAPAIRFHKGEFYIFYGDPDFGIYMVKARNAAGPWAPPVLLRSAKGWIDPAPFWDDDGNAYLVHAWANSRSGIKSILTINRMSADGTKLLDDGKMVFDGRANHPTIEGPKLYKRNGYYYIFAPAGGVSTGWQTVLRSKNIYGPYEDRIVMDQGRTAINGPHQGGWVELKSGESWFVHFQDRAAYGRVVHLQPMKWIDDWPVIGVDEDGDGKGEPVATHRKPNVGRAYPAQSPQTSDEFASNKLGLQWQWHANPQANWYDIARGSLRLTSVPSSRDLMTTPHLLLQKLPARKFTVTTLIDASRLLQGERSGLLMMGREYSYLAVSGPELMRVTGGKEGVVAQLKTKSVFLRISVDNATAEFSYSTDGNKFFPAGEPFAMKPGVWIGAKVGLFSLAPADATAFGSARYDWFRFAPLERSAQTRARAR